MSCKGNICCYGVIVLMLLLASYYFLRHRNKSLQKTHLQVTSSEGTGVLQLGDIEQGIPIKKVETHLETQKDDASTTVSSWEATKDGSTPHSNEVIKDEDNHMDPQVDIEEAQDPKVPPKSSVDIVQVIETTKHNPSEARESVEKEQVEALEDDKPSHQPAVTSVKTEAKTCHSAGVRKTTTPGDAAALKWKEDFTQDNLLKLLDRKRVLKQELKQFDVDFACRHGRPPLKAEKELIRYKYKAYKLIKLRIKRLELENHHSAPPKLKFIVVPTEWKPSPSTPKLTYGDYLSVQENVLVTQRHLPNKINQPFDRLYTAYYKHLVEDLLGMDKSVRQEKKDLHTELRAYEKDFFKRHGRQVRLFQDIKPVASNYRRYKETKRIINLSLSEADLRLYVLR